MRNKFYQHFRRPVFFQCFPFIVSYAWHCPSTIFKHGCPNVFPFCICITKQKLVVLLGSIFSCHPFCCSQYKSLPQIHDVILFILEELQLHQQICPCFICSFTSVVLEGIIIQNSISDCCNCYNSPNYLQIKIFTVQQTVSIPWSHTWRNFALQLWILTEIKLKFKRPKSILNCINITKIINNIQLDKPCQFSPLLYVEKIFYTAFPSHP